MLLHRILQLGTLFIRVEIIREMVILLPQTCLLDWPFRQHGIRWPWAKQQFVYLCMCAVLWIRNWFVSFYLVTMQKKKKKSGSCISKSSWNPSPPWSYPTHPVLQDSKYINNNTNSIQYLTIFCIFRVLDKLFTHQLLRQRSEFQLFLCSNTKFIFYSLASLQQ